LFVVAEAALETTDLSLLRVRVCFKGGSAAFDGLGLPLVEIYLLDVGKIFYLDLLPGFLWQARGSRQ